MTEDPFFTQLDATYAAYKRMLRIAPYLCSICKIKEITVHFPIQHITLGPPK